MSNNSDKQKQINEIAKELKTNGQIIKKLHWNFSNLSNTDSLYARYISQQNNQKEEISFADLNKKIAEMSKTIGNLTNKTTELDIIVKSSKNIDELELSNIFKFNNFYTSIPYQQYLYKSNSISLKQNFSVFKRYLPKQSINNKLYYNRKIDNKAFFIEDEISGGFDYKHDNNKIGFFIQNVFFLSGNNEIVKKFKYSLSKEDVKRNREQKTFKMSFNKNISNERTFLFRDNLIFDPINKFTLSYAHKVIANNFDDANSSLKLKTETPEEDSLHQLKLSLTGCKFDLNPFNFLEDKTGRYMNENNPLNNSSLTYKISSSLNSSLNSNFIENKFFIRKLSIFRNNFIHQLNLEGGNIINFNKDKNLKIHEFKYLNNFKGIYNPGEKAIIEEGKTGDCLGNNYFFTIKNKFFYNNIPLISNYKLKKDNFEIMPFSYLNFLLCGNNSLKNEDFNRSHLSAGFGINVLTEYANFEIYYNIFSKKNKYDISPEFGINIGFD
jgi:hypothetical protein